MMNYAYDTSLQETMILTEAFHTDRVICDNGSLYKFIWVQEGKLTLIVDHVEIEMEQDEIISVSNLHRTEFKNVSGRYLALLFNENFYGIYKHEKEVSCSGVLFNGTSGIVHLRLPITDSELLHEVVDRMVTEYILRDNLQGEMLRLLLNVSSFCVPGWPVSSCPAFRLMKKVLTSSSVIMCWWTITSRRKNRYRHMLLCCIVLPRRFPIYLPPTVCLPL